MNTKLKQEISVRERESVIMKMWMLDNCILFPSQLWIHDTVKVTENKLRIDCY